MTRTKKKGTTAKARANARQPVKNGHAVKSLSAQIVDLARSKHGCTAEEVYALTERVGGRRWPSFSMPQIAKSQGVKLRKEKRKGEAIRYFVA
jgi:hypothetical protein